MNRLTKMLGGLLLAGLVAACGGGGGSSGSTPGGEVPGDPNNPPVAVPASIDVFTSTPELSSAGNSTVSFTVVVKDANNQAIPNQSVNFSASSGNLNGALPAPTTGAAGEAITTVTLSPGDDKANRDITVTITAGGASRQIVVPVTGTSISLSGDSAVLLGGSTTVTAKVVDSAGTAVSGARLTVRSASNNGLAPTTLTTNAQGAATFTYTGTNAGSDRVTVSGVGTSASTTISVSPDVFTFLTPAANASLTIGTAHTVTVRYLSGGAPVVGRTVNFSTTRGTVSSSTAVTNGSGQASVTVRSDSSGPATVVAQTTTAQVNLPLTFVATTPANLVLQANPGALAPNTGGATTNQAELSATVRDAVGNPVAGKIVNFTATIDGSNGSISPGSAVTDDSGTAKTQFISGPRTTANNGVEIRATVQGTAISSTARLTVNSEALFIAISFGNTVGNVGETTYKKEFSVVVTDANGAPAANRVVNLSVFPDSYGKGVLVFNGTNWVIEAASFVQCPNEDLDRDGILDTTPVEDVNGNGTLQPGLPVAVAPASVTTDASGFATFTLRYGENFVPWVYTTITARAAVGGTESVMSQFYYLQGVSTDFSNEDVAPAGVVSPYGTGACNVSN